MAAETTHARREREGSNSEAIEDCLKAVYTLALRSEGSVATGDLAGRLGVTPATATAMLKLSLIHI